ncbi:MAG TPA: RimK family alpha-L-glutamate ligase [Thermoleophilia bacterium]|nr:RimK family alpha-L-glutamate ligase [Thermoleophilia bacterium]
MRVVILGRRGGWHTESLLRALERRRVAAECCLVTQLTARIGGHPVLSASGIVLEGQDVVFVRAIPSGSLEQVIFRMDALRCLEQTGVRVVNPPASIEYGVDKYYTAALLEAAGLPTPRTVVAERFGDALAAFEELGGDVVVKPLFGSEGKGMVRVSDADSAYRLFRALELGRYVYCLQEFLDHDGADVRAFVIGDEVVAAMLRRGAHWKTNAAQGGRGEPYPVDDRLRELSLRAVRLVGAEYAGVDLVPRGDDYTVLEVNSIPGWRVLKAATGIDIGQHVVDHVLGVAP